MKGTCQNHPEWVEIYVVSLKLMRLKLFIPTEDLAQILFGVGQQHASRPTETQPERNLSIGAGAVTQGDARDPSGLSPPWASSKDLPGHGDRPFWISPGCVWTPRILYRAKHGPFGKSG